LLISGFTLLVNIGASGLLFLVQIAKLDKIFNPFSLADLLRVDLQLLRNHQNGFQSHRSFQVKVQEVRLDIVLGGSGWETNFSYHRLNHFFHVAVWHLRISRLGSIGKVEFSA